MTEQDTTPEPGSGAHRAEKDEDSGTREDRSADDSSTTSASEKQSPQASSESSGKHPADPDPDANEAPTPVAEKGRSRVTSVAIALGATALTIWLLREFNSVVAPVFLAANLLITAYPIYTWLTKRNVPKLVGTLATGLAVLIVLLLGVAAIVWSGTSMVSTLLGYSDQFTQLYNDAIGLVSSLGFNEDQLLQQLRSISPSNVLGVVSGVLSNASSAGSVITVILVTMVFMLMDLPSMATRLGVTDRLHPAFTSNVQTFVSGIRRYWLVTTIFGLIVAVIDGFALFFLGVSLPVVWAVLSFITNYIPNIGFVIGLIPPALLALVEQGWVTALLVVLFYSVANFVLQGIIQPKFTGDAVGITPTVSFLSLLLWAAVFGPLGALIALPFTLMIKAMLIDNDPKTRWINAMISSKPKEAVQDT